MSNRFELEFCTSCGIMSNHLNKVCQKHNPTSTRDKIGAVKVANTAGPDWTLDFLPDSVTDQILEIIAEEVKAARIDELTIVEAMTHEGRGTILWEMDALCEVVSGRIEGLRLAELNKGDKE